MRKEFFAFFAILVLLCQICLAQEKVQKPTIDSGMARVILDAIVSNLNSIESFEAVIVHTADTTRIIENKPTRRVFQKMTRYWYDAKNNKRRCDIDFVTTVERNGKNHEIPHHQETVFDGGSTYSYRKHYVDGSIEAGYVPKEDTNIMERPYYISSQDFRKKIKDAETFETVVVDGQRLLKLHFGPHLPDPKFRGFTRDIWLNPQKAYYIEREEFRVDGKLGSLRTTPKILKFGTTWIATEMNEKMYSEDGTLLHEYSTVFDIRNYGKTIKSSVFHLDFPPGTWVEDHVEGKTYTVEYPIRDNENPWQRRLVVIALVNTIAIGFIVWRIIQRRK
jgi:hypothetical protein